jgi:hypothetical protein
MNGCDLPCCFSHHSIKAFVIPLDSSKILLQLQVVPIICTHRLIYRKLMIFVTADRNLSSNEGKMDFGSAEYNFVQRCSFFPSDQWSNTFVMLTIKVVTINQIRLFISHSVLWLLCNAVRHPKQFNKLLLNQPLFQHNLLRSFGWWACQKQNYSGSVIALVVVLAANASVDQMYLFALYSVH